MIICRELIVRDLPEEDDPVFESERANALFQCVLARAAPDDEEARRRARHRGDRVLDALVVDEPSDEEDERRSPLGAQGIGTRAQCLRRVKARHVNSKRDDDALLPIGAKRGGVKMPRRSDDDPIGSSQKSLEKRTIETSQQALPNDLAMERDDHTRVGIHGERGHGGHRIRFVDVENVGASFGQQAWQRGTERQGGDVSPSGCTRHKHAVHPFGHRRGMRIGDENMQLHVMAQFFAQVLQDRLHAAGNREVEFSNLQDSHRYTPQVRVAGPFGGSRRSSSSTRVTG